MSAETDVIDKICKLCLGITLKYTRYGYGDGYGLAEKILKIIEEYDNANNR